MASTISHVAGWLHPLHTAGSCCDFKLVSPIHISKEIATVQGLSSFAIELVESHSAVQDEYGRQVQVLLGQEGMELRLGGHIGKVSRTVASISLRLCDLVTMQARRQQFLVIGRRDGVARIGYSKQGNRCHADGCFSEMWLLAVDGDETVLHNILNSMNSLGAIRSDFTAIYNLAERPIASGSFSAVYVARRVRQGVQSRSPAMSATSPCDIGSEIHVAAKVFSKGTADHGTSVIACTEAALLLEVQGHPGIIRFRGIFTLPDAVESDTLPWVIAMEWCSKGDLLDHVKANGPFFEEHAVEIAIDVFAALAHVHARGIVHRDVKPENILLSDNNRPLLSDFGIASRVDNEGGLEQRCGTPGYAAPEILNGSKYDSKVDVFSTGVVLYFILCGSLPFCGAGIAIVMARTARCKIRFPPESFGQVSHHVKQFVRLLMRKEPNDRPSAQTSMRIAWNHWCRDHLGSAEWLQDIESRAKQKFLDGEGRKAATPELSPEHMMSEGIQDPSSNPVRKPVKAEVLLADSVDHGYLWKTKQIPAAASITDVSVAVEYEVASTSVLGPAASDAFVEDRAVVNEMAQDELAFCKGSRSHASLHGGGTPNSSKTDFGHCTQISCDEDVILAQETLSEISDARQDIQTALTSPKPELIQESVVKPLRLHRKNPKVPKNALSASVTQVEQLAMTAMSPSGPNTAYRRPASMWSKSKKDASPINATFHFSTHDARCKQGAQHCSLEDNLFSELDRCESASPSPTLVAPSGSFTNRVQRYFCRGSRGNEEASRVQDRLNGMAPFGRRFFKPVATRLGERPISMGEATIASDDEESPSFKERLTDLSERASEQTRRERTHKSDVAEGVMSDSSEDVFGIFRSGDQCLLDRARSKASDGSVENILQADV